MNYNEITLILNPENCSDIKTVHQKKNVSI